MTNIAVHLANGFEEIEAITIIDVLRRAKLNVTTISISDNRNVVGSHQIPVMADKLFTEVDYSTIDVIVLPGGRTGAENLDQHEGLRNQIIQFHHDKKLLGAICAAPLVFGHLNILKGEKAVCYPGFESELHGAEILELPTVRSGNVITGRGAGVAMKFALKLIEELISKQKADDLAKAMVVEGA
ncbi:MAG TPA: DJ-1 family glyoxalase III [Sunxiuqinia sp.]|nr:DJ-1 family glyoxalase III [Sunxiuqinia sp.]